MDTSRKLEGRGGGTPPILPACRVSFGSRPPAEQTGVDPVIGEFLPEGFQHADLTPDQMAALQHDIDRLSGINDRTIRPNSDDPEGMRAARALDEADRIAAGKYAFSPRVPPAEPTADEQRRLRALALVVGRKPETDEERATVEQWIAEEAARYHPDACLGLKPYPRRRGR